MKKLILAIVALGAFSASATHYSWTDFDLNQRAMLTLGKYASKEDAKQAGVAAISQIEAGQLMGLNKKIRYIGGNDDCKSLWSNNVAKAVGNFIARRGEYARVRMGFSISESFSSDGTALYSAKVDGFMPCLAPQDDD
ncbi:MAG: hypothetical protein HRT45_01785 [Bdellovibrionales bacterium]|nr:hypothetical protein [Bdellovibrionales bacterium]